MNGQRSRPLCIVVMALYVAWLSWYPTTSSGAPSGVAAPTPSASSLASGQSSGQSANPAPSVAPIAPPSEKEADKVAAAFWTAAATIAVGIATIAYNMLQRLKMREEERDAMLVAIQSDISALDGVIKSMVSSFDPKKREIPLPVWIDGPRTEDYFQLFGELVDKIGHLDPEVARPVVSFYTHFKLSRDAAFPLEALRKVWDEKYMSQVDVPEPAWTILGAHVGNVKTALRHVETSACEALIAIDKARVPKVALDSFAAVLFFAATGISAAFALTSSEMSQPPWVAEYLRGAAPAIVLAAAGGGCWLRAQHRRLIRHQFRLTIKLAKMRQAMDSSALQETAREKPLKDLVAAIAAVPRIPLPLFAATLGGAVAGVVGLCLCAGWRVDKPSWAAAVLFGTAAFTVFACVFGSRWLVVKHRDLTRHGRELKSTRAEVKRTLVRRADEANNLPKRLGSASTQAASVLTGRRLPFAVALACAASVAALVARSW